MASRKKKGSQRNKLLLKSISKMNEYFQSDEHGKQEIQHNPNLAANTSNILKLKFLCVFFSKKDHI